MLIFFCKNNNKINEKQIIFNIQYLYKIKFILYHNFVIKKSIKFHSHV